MHSQLEGVLSAGCIVCANHIWLGVRLYFFSFFYLQALYDFGDSYGHFFNLHD